MPIRNTELDQFGGNGTGYSYEVFGTVANPVDEVVDYAAIPINTYFKHIDKQPDVDVVLYKNSAGEIIDPANPNFFPAIWASTQCLG
jgi:hypothetical protein